VGVTRFLATVGFLGVLLVTYAPPPAAPQASSYDLPIIDAHDHLQAQARAEDLVHLMDLAGVARMVLMAQVGTEHGSDDQSLMFAQRYPDRFVPFVAFQVPLLASAGSEIIERWMHPDDAALTFLRQTEDKLKSGKFFGLGEIIARHYAYKTRFGAVAPEINIPVDSPLMHQFAQLAAKYRVPMLIHAEGEPLVVSAMERLLTAHPDARIIWAHNCGRQSAERITKLLEHHPNLFCDLAAMTNQGGPFSSRMEAVRSSQK
jgi:Tat protein secretion system quality control protein TatD with DNase activity